MDAFRHSLALYLIVATPAGFCLWFVIHPFVHFWRRMGPIVTYAVALIVALGIVDPLVRARRPMLAVEFGTNYWLVGLGVLLVVASVVMRKYLGRQLKFRTLVGLPEVAPNKYPQRLLTEGVYSHIRHPRYVEILITLLGCSLIANYLAAYVLFVVTCIGVWAIVGIEERELRERFGAEWDEYAARVPRFLPKLQTK